MNDQELFKLKALRALILGIFDNFELDEVAPYRRPFLDGKIVLQVWADPPGFNFSEPVGMVVSSEQIGEQLADEAAEFLEDDTPTE